MEKWHRRVEDEMSPTYFRSIVCGISMCRGRLGDIYTHGVIGVKLITSTVVGLLHIQRIFWKRAHFNVGIIMT